LNIDFGDTKPPTNYGYVLIDIPWEQSFLL